MRVFLFGGLTVLLLMCGARADTVDLEPVTCTQFKAGYDILSSQPFSAEDGSLEVAIHAITDNHLLLNRIETEYMTREQLAEYLSRQKPIDALIWLQTTYTAIEYQLQRCNQPFEQKRLVLVAPQVIVKPGKACGSPTIPDLSKPLKKTE